MADVVARVHVPGDRLSKKLAWKNYEQSFLENIFIEIKKTKELEDAILVALHNHIGVKVSPKEVRAEYLRLLGEFLIVASEMGGIDAIDFKKKLKEMKKKYKQINKSLLDKNLHKYERQLDHLLQKQASLLEKIKEDINEQSAKLDSIMIDKSIKGQDGESRTK